jgi:hypothetical protein
MQNLGSRSGIDGRICLSGGQPFMREGPAATQANPRRSTPCFCANFGGISSLGCIGFGLLGPRALSVLQSSMSGSIPQSLGVGQDVSAGVIYDLLATDDLPGGLENPDSSLKALYIELDDWCKSNRISTPTKKFSMSAIGRSKSSYQYPCLSSEFKASHVKV